MPSQSEINLWDVSFSVSHCTMFPFEKALKLLEDISQVSCTSVPGMHGGDLKSHFWKMNEHNSTLKNPSSQFWFKWIAFRREASL